MEAVAINAESRVAGAGKAAAKTARREGVVPCVLYSKDENIQFVAQPLELRHLIYTPDFKVAEIQLDGKMHKCILKSVQYHPVTDQVIHVDFLKLVDGVSLKVEVPVRFTGTSIGVKEGGKLQQLLRKVKIKTTPEKLVNELTLDISNLKLGQSIRVRDIQPSEGVEIINAPGIPVGIIEIPRALRSAGAKAEK